MSDRVTVAFADNFLTSFANLPRQIQVKVTDFINKFRNNPKSSSIHMEKLKNSKDDKIFSARINDEYRAILAIEEDTGVYLVLWVDHHDEAYEWARRKKCLINKELGSIQVFDVLDESEESPISESYLFESYSNAQLIDIGVPEEQLSLVKHIIDLDEFNSMKDSFSKETYENLEWLANDFNYDEVKALYDEQKITVSPATIEEALQNDSTKQSFVIVEGEDELVRIMSEPLEKWRIFLHPSQRKVVEKNYNGPARVTGGAGTGKTVVAIHRAKHLSNMLEPEKRILFTTFTANLASDIEENLKKICTVQEMRNIDVMHLDSWVARFLKANGYNYTIDYDRIDNVWEQAYINSGESLDFDYNFVKEEYIKIIVCQNEISLPAYMSASRIGRGVKIDRPTKLKIWHIVEEYNKIMRDERIRDIDTAMYECRRVLMSLNKRTQYQYVVVDEAQDFSTNAFKLLRLIAGDEHSNDMFIVGDSHQRIYKKKAILSKCGINVRGRSNILKINYRTTEEIRKYAFALLKGIPFDDLDNNQETQDFCQSLTHGEKPIIKNFKDGNAEFDYIKNEINSLLNSGVEAMNICIVCRTNKYCNQYNSMLSESGIKVFEIKRSNSDDRSRNGIRVSTMHRIKGLEFQYIFVVACNNRVVPLTSAITNQDPIAKEESIISERCLLYVSLTRAQKKAYITSYGKQSEFLD